MKNMNPFSQLRNTKTLLVDDDEFIRDSLRIVFDSKGCFLKTAETAEEEKYDIIISDFRLSGIDGLRFLRFASLIQAEPIKLLITAYKDDHVLNEAERIGVNQCVEKPFSVDAFINLLVLMLKKKATKTKIDIEPNKT